MHITGTHFNYYMLCHRKLWLFANGIQMEHTSDLVYEGKLVHETSYNQRSEKYEEIEIGGIKIDYFDSKNNIIHEIKLSDKIEDAHEWQLRYYIYVLEQAGIKSVSGILEYPNLRKTHEIQLTDFHRKEIKEIKHKILHLVNSEACPEIKKKKICNRCSYYDFCFSNEIE